MAGFVWIGVDVGIQGVDVAYLAFVLTIAVGLLMVSNIRYYSFKEFDFKNRVPFTVILLVVMVYVFASIDPPKVLFSGFLVYALSGIAYTVVKIRMQRRLRNRTE